MIDRYKDRVIYDNTEEIYQNIIFDRNVKILRHFNTPNIYRPTPEEYNSINYIEHIWTVGDRYYKLSYKYYNNVNDWWVIALFNNRPTESHNKIGDVVKIPSRIIDVVKLFKL